MTGAQFGRKAPFAVVGGGFVGLCTAIHLRRAGLEVVLIDPGDTERAASYGNAGQFAVGEVVPLAVPGVVFSVPKWLLDPLGPLTIRWRDLPALTPWLLRFLKESRRARMEAVSRTMAALCDLIHLDYEPIIRDSAAQHIIADVDCIRLYETRQQWEAERPTWQLRERAGLKVDLLDGDALHAMEPGIGPAYQFGAVMKGRTYVRNLVRLMQAFAALLAREGGTLVTGEVGGFELGEQGVAAVRLLDGRSIAVGGIAITAGAWSAKLAAQLGDSVPLESERGYHVMLPNAGVKLRRSITMPSRGMGLIPMEEGLRLAGTVELAKLGSPPNFARADRLIENARSILPGINTEGARRWMGNRPSFPDSLPLIDRASRVTNAYYAFGHGHMGVSWAATTGRLVAGLVVGRPTNFDLSPLRLSRF